MQAEIARVRLQLAPHRQVAPAGTGTSGEPPHDGDVMPPAGGWQRPPGAPAMSPEERLTRSWLVDGLMRNASICLGDEAVFVTAGRGGKESLLRKHDAAGANRALELLDKQLDKMAGAPPDDAADARPPRLRPRPRPRPRQPAPTRIPSPDP